MMDMGKYQTQWKNYCDRNAGVEFDGIVGKDGYEYCGPVDEDTHFKFKVWQDDSLVGPHVPCSMPVDLSEKFANVLLYKARLQLQEATND